MTQAKITFRDGREVEVSTTVADTCAWEQYALGAGLVVYSPLQSGVYAAYSAAKREGAIDKAMPYEAFMAELDAMPQQVTPANPTKKARGGGSSSK